MEALRQAALGQAPRRRPRRAAGRRRGGRQGGPGGRPADADLPEHRRDRRQSADGARQGPGRDRARCADRRRNEEPAMRLRPVAGLIAALLLAACSLAARADLSRAGNPCRGRAAGRQRRRRGGALLRRQACASLRQAGDRREQARHDPVDRRRRRRQGEARRLHRADHLGHVVARRQSLQLQEAALRPDQGLHAGRHAAAQLLHPDGAAGGALADRERTDRGDEGRRATRRATATAARRRSPPPSSTRRARACRRSASRTAPRWPRCRRCSAASSTSSSSTPRRARRCYASGKLRGLAVTTGQRVPGVDLPTMAEAASIPEFDIAPTWGVFLPAGAPAPIVAQLESGSARSCRWMPPGVSSPTPTARRFPATPRSWRSSCRRKSRSGRSWRSSRKSSRNRRSERTAALPSSGRSASIAPDSGAQLFRSAHRLRGRASAFAHQSI